MNPYRASLIVVAAIAFAFSCWLVFWTDSAVKFARTRNHSEAGSPQKSPRSQIAFEPWYPLYVRFEGIWLWAMIAFLLSFAFKG